MSKKRNNKFDRPWVLLCEGRGDENFYNRLISLHNLDQQFIVKQSGFEDGQGAGRGAFGLYLNNAREVEEFEENVEAVLVVSDNDLDPDKSFKEVQAELAKVKGVNIPESEQVVAKNKGFPDLVVLMIPIGKKKGTLETICLPSAYQKWNIKDQLDTYVASVPAANFTEVKQAKMRMQTILASTNDDHPEAGFAAHWKKDEKYQVPLNHPCFDDLVAFLKSFGDLVAAEVVEA